MDDFIYPVSFLCHKCNKMKKNITYRHIFGKIEYMCDLCWKKFFLSINLKLLENISIKEYQ